MDVLDTNQYICMVSSVGQVVQVWDEGVAESFLRFYCSQFSHKLIYGIMEYLYTNKRQFCVTCNNWVYYLPAIYFFNVSKSSLVKTH